GDGYVDLAISNRGGNEVTFWMGQSDGTFALDQSIAVGRQPVAVAVRSAGAPYPGVLVANADSGSVTLLVPHGDFGKAVNYVVGENPTAIAAGNFTSPNADNWFLAVTYLGTDPNAGRVAILRPPPTGRDGTFELGLSYPVGRMPGAVA